MEMILRKTIFILLVAFVFVSCKKKFDEPAVKAPPTISGFITIDSIFKKYNAYYITASPKPTKWFKFTDNATLECVVTADESSGNIYKTVFVEDATGALEIKLLNSGGLYVGDKIRVNLNGVVLDDYGDMVQLDSVDIEKSVVKVSSGNPVVPTKVTYNQLLAFNTAGHTPFQSRLVVVDSVEFSIADKKQMFADPVGKYSIDRVLKNAFNTELILRSSGYANFAASSVPCGKGTMTVIAGQYNSDVQLTIRNFKEVKMANNGCPYLVKSFNYEGVLSQGWTNYRVNGAIDWVATEFNGKKYGQISNYVGGGNQVCETWYISPPMDITNATNPTVSFISAQNYLGPALEVYVSTNYVSGNPNSSTWVNLNPTLSSGSWNWVSSGILSLGAYKTANTRIAFKYTGTSTSGSTWEIDDIAIFTE